MHWYSHDNYHNNDLLEEKLTVAIQAISVIEDKHDDANNDQAVYIHEIYLYNSEEKSCKR